MLISIKNIRFVFFCYTHHNIIYLGANIPNPNTVTYTPVTAPPRINVKIYSNIVIHFNICSNHSNINSSSFISIYKEKQLNLTMFD